MRYDGERRGGGRARGACRVDKEDGREDLVRAEFVAYGKRHRRNLDKCIQSKSGKRDSLQNQHLVNPLALQQALQTSVRADAHN